MNAIIKKERRLLRPSFVATIAITVASALIFNGGEASNIVMIVFALGVGLMAASAFGSEFNARTMVLLLSQPVPRRQLWLEKMRELGLELAVSFVVLLISLAFLVRGEGRLQSFSATAVMMLAVAPLVAFCSTPFASLSIRNTLGAMALTVGIPWSLVMLVLGADWLVSHALLGWDRLLLDQAFDRQPYLATSALVLAGLGYCAVLYWLGYQTFLNFEIIDSQAADVALPAALENRLAGWAEKLIPGYTSPFASLVRKELRLHHVSFIIAGLNLLVTPFLALAMTLHRSDLTAGLSLAPLFVCIILIPFLTGLATVTEERNFGVLNWQLTFPVSQRKQWWVKILTAFSTCVALGLVLPGLMLYVGHLLFGFGEDFFQSLNDWADWIGLVMLYFSLFNVVVFASSITTNVTRGVVAALGLLTACTTVITLGGSAFERTIKWWFGNVYIPLPREWGARPNGLLILILMLVLFLLWNFAVNWFSFTNFKSDRISGRRLWLQLSIIPLLAGVLSFALLFVEFWIQ